MALDMIDVAANAGADAVKFQTFKAEALSTQYAEKAQYQKQTTTASESQQDMLKALELHQDDYAKLVERCEKADIEFMSTAFDIESMDFLVNLGIQRIKIPSGELTNVPFVRHCASKGLPVILSTGMANMMEITTAVEVIFKAGLPASQLSILHCNTAYPTPFNDANLNCILSFAKSHSGIDAVGYSDHTLGDEAVIASVALGASIVEKHFTLDRFLPGPDQSTSLEPGELKAMIEKVRHIELALGDGIKAPTTSEKENIAIARKSIVASVSIKKGDVLNSENLTTKRPATGLSAERWDDVIDGIASRDFVIDEQIEL
jgi:N,N'-diacetyllegionaminate synthase